VKIVFMGTGEIALPSLDWLLEESGHEVVAVFTQPDKPAGRGLVLTPPEAKLRAERKNVPVFQPVSFKSEPEAMERLEEMRCDLAVVMAYGQILPRRVIQAPGIACVNIHASLLPRHRGASPIQAAIREGDSQSGLTLMHIVPKLDAGDMILRLAIDLDPRETGGSLHDRLAALGPEILRQGLPLLGEGGAPREKQDESQVTYSGKLGREDGLIDWRRPAREIERLVRAYDPWPGTSTALPGGKSLKIFPFAELMDGSPGAAPGTILEAGETLVVACGAGGALRFTGDLQSEGKKRVPVREFLRGAHFVPGTLLGSPAA